jgi:hypothetical protein
MDLTYGFAPNNMAELSALLFHIWKVMGSNLGPETSYPDRFP